MRLECLRLDPKQRDVLSGDAGFVLAIKSVEKLGVTPDSDALTPSVEACRVYLHKP